jgi:hypothetical protein
MTAAKKIGNFMVPPERNKLWTKKVFPGRQYSAYAPWSQSKKGSVYCLTRLLQEKSGEQLDERGRTYCRHSIRELEENNIRIVSYVPVVTT